MHLCNLELALSRPKIVPCPFWTAYRTLFTSPLPVTLGKIVQFMTTRYPLHKHWQSVEIVQYFMQLSIWFHVGSMTAVSIVFPYLNTTIFMFKLYS